MPSKNRRLKEFAKKKCIKNGHKMGNFYMPWPKLNANMFRSGCKNCFRMVEINEHEVSGGSAYIYQCDKRK
jgi:hypothetical protein